MGKCNFSDVVLNSGGYIAEFSSQRGATCFRLFHERSGREILRFPEDEETFFENVFLYGNPVLFPPNRIRGGKFSFRGREYCFPVNEPRTNCHLHGELYQRRFEISRKTETEAEFTFRAQAGEYLGFPHAFLVTRAYMLDKNGLTETFTVQNLSDEDMPFMLAFHTTFSVQNGKLQQAVGREELRNELFLPIGEFKTNLRGEAISAGNYVIGQEHLSALYEARGNTATITDTAYREKICYCASEDYRYRMLYAPVRAGFICIEPQTCAIDCFHLPSSAEENGLIVLSPREKRSLKTRIWVENDGKE